MLDGRKLPVATGLVALALTACSWHPGPPRLDKEWASKERDVATRATSKGTVEEVRVVVAGDEDERPTLGSLEGSDRARGTRLVARLKPGRHRLTAKVTLHDATLVIEGEGPEKTRLLVDGEDEHSLVVVGGRLELRGLTLACYSGGGVAASKADVVVSNVDFAGATYGLSLEASTARVASCVFAGCSAGMIVEGGETHVSGSAFRSCWDGIRGKGRLAVEGCVFEGQKHKAIDVRLARGSSVASALFVETGDLGWSGAPDVLGCLVPEGDLGTRAPREANAPIHYLQQFPEALPAGFPGTMDVAAVTYALERSKTRGQADSSERVRDALLDWARRWARIAREASRGRDKRGARAAARLALDFVSVSGDPEARDEVRDLEPLLR